MKSLKPQSTDDICCVRYILVGIIDCNQHCCCERYANHILWMAVCRMILTVWESTRKKIWLGGEVLYLSKQAAARV